MTPNTRLGAALNTLGWRSSFLARRFRCSPRVVQLWIEGRSAAPEPIVEYAETCAEVIQRIPVPAIHLTAGRRRKEAS